MTVPVIPVIHNLPKPSALDGKGVEHTSGWLFAAISIMFSSLGHHLWLLDPCSPPLTSLCSSVKSFDFIVLLSSFALYEGMLSCIETKDCYLHPSKCVGIFISIPLTQDQLRSHSWFLCRSLLGVLLSSSPKKWVPYFVHCLGYHFSRGVLFPDSNQSLASVTIRYEPRTIWSVPHHVWHFDDIGLFVVVCFIYFIGAAFYLPPVAQTVELLYLPPVKWSSNPKAPGRFHYILVPLFVATFDHVFHWMNWLGALSKSKGSHCMVFLEGTDGSINSVARHVKTTSPRQQSLKSKETTYLIKCWPIPPSFPCALLPSLNE